MVTKLGVVGAIFFCLGLIAGFVPFSSNVNYCGSAFVPSSVEQEYAPVIDMFERYSPGPPPLIAESLCDELRWLIRIPAVGLVAAGGSVLIGAWYAATQAAGRARASGRPTPWA
jgi:hypothetical protein